jgi:methionyl-tRNA formyltransferase
VNNKILAFKTQDGWAEIKNLQIEGKKRMPTEEFLKGFRI